MNFQEHLIRNLAILVLLLLSFNTSNAQFVINGTITSEQEVPLGNVYVAISGSMEEAILTDENGYYEFIVPDGGNYIISPCQNLNPLNGVTTYDNVLISQHIEGITSFTSPYTIIAADVDQDQSLTMLDNEIMIQMVRSEISEFPNNKSWRFIDAAFEFSDPNDPFSEIFPEEGIVDNLEDDVTINFIGVKLGDINQSAAPLLSANSDDITEVCFPNVTSNKSILESQVELNGFPNPFKEEFFIPLGQEYTKTIIEIYSSSGKQLSTRIFNNTDRIKLGLSQKAAGIYFIHVILEDKSEWIQMVKN